jgi:hypothetical protein
MTIDIGTISPDLARTAIKRALMDEYERLTSSVGTLLLQRGPKMNMPFLVAELMKAEKLHQEWLTLG